MGGHLGGEPNNPKGRERMTKCNKQGCQVTPRPSARKFIHGPLTGGGAAVPACAGEGGPLCTPQCEAGGPAKAAPSTGLGHITCHQKLMSTTFLLQILSLRKTGRFIEQKRNTNVRRRDQLCVWSWTGAQGLVRSRLHPAPRVARLSCLVQVQGGPARRAGQIRPTIWSICRM